ncbi:MAG TPA: HD domain-containing protein [Leptolyngbyaceae cyanobacterium M33_DOE_097]|uniref:GAF domain-containing protein n=1 Tax=Oscillatoriales cyanobacterium SpSt-418 TaxID=2282169 RepID=A0A7C3KJW9_9CYAN|nr:HD domain-containing protein [Leptolyngbyaceae cyanobacterium M33_DOE_097]
MTDSPNDLQQVAWRAELVEQLLAIGTALSGSHSLGELLNLILQKSREITLSDAGSVYLIDRTSEVPVLWFKAAQNFSKPSASFQEFAMPLLHRSLAGYVALTGESLNIEDAYELSGDLPYRLDRSFDQSIGYRTRSVLVLPMQNQEGETIGVLQLINRKRDPKLVITPENVCEVTQSYTLWEQRVLRSLASQAAISIERNHLQESIEQLFEGFVRASVQIIEARDPCTSGHSERVAALTVRLSEEVNTVDAGVLGATCFDERQIQEIRYAALLHDFGKVGVPEAILGKQKKLYPLELEVVRNRFALAQRTLEMECAQQKFRYLIDNPEYQLLHSTAKPGECSHCRCLSQLDEDLEAAIARLNDYWEVLSLANEPRILSEEPIAKLQEIAQLTYRDVDDTFKPLLTQAEFEQLMVARGNLTYLEREAIQAHVSHTYEFLKQIPWTKQLENVPMIAYGHHEKLDGTGYPRGLKAPDIPIQAQIMAIADIYDALTAGDRPYKRGLPVTTALTILKQEAAHNKLNHELVTLFEQRHVFKVIRHELESISRK